MKYFHWQPFISLDYREYLEKLLNTDQYQQSKIVKSNKRRCIYYLELPPFCHGNLYLKKDTPLDLRNKIKNLWRWKSQEELKSANLLNACGIHVVNHLGWVKEGQNSFLLTQEFKDGITLSQAMKTYPQAKADLQQICKYIFITCWQNNICHPDFHCDNILVRQDIHGVWDYALVDVYGVKQQNSNSAKATLMFFYYQYLRNTYPSYQAQQDLDQEMAEQLKISIGTFKIIYNLALKRSWKKNKSHFTYKKEFRLNHLETQHISWSFSPYSLPEATIQAIENAFWQKQYQQLKNDIKRQVYRIIVDGKTYILKTYTPQPWKPSFLRTDYRCWINTNQLQIYQIPVAPVLAWGRGKGKKGYIILEDVGNLSIANYIKDLSEEEKNTTAKLLGELLAQLHNLNIYHSDLKVANIHVIPQLAPKMILRLLDCDQINTHRPITDKMIKHNLTQLALAFNGHHLDQEKYNLIKQAYQQAKIS